MLEVCSIALQADIVPTQSDLGIRSCIKLVAFVHFLQVLAWKSVVRLERFQEDDFGVNTDSAAGSPNLGIAERRHLPV